MESYINQIYSWLAAGFSQHPTRLAEMFYFDKGESKFFSILITDYFLFEEDFTIAKNARSGYSDDTLNELANKMKRIEDEDAAILLIPRLGDSLSDIEILAKIDTFLNLNSINLINTSLWDPEEGGDITVQIV